MGWKVTKIIVNPSEGSYTDVVVTVLWSYTVTQLVSGVTYTGVTSSSTNVPAPSTTFTPYSQLTEEQVLSWIWANGVNKGDVEFAASEQLQNQINTTPALPWGE